MLRYIGCYFMLRYISCYFMLCYITCHVKLYNMLSYVIKRVMFCSVYVKL